MLRLASLLLACFLALPSAAQPLTIDQVEPPNWWVGMRWHTVQLMVYGDDLRGTTAAFDDDRLQVTATHFLTHPGYAFVDVTVPDDLPAGSYTLTLTRGEETATVPFPIHERAPSEGRHQGFSRHDVVYLITPDRFANGDPSNDRHPGVRDDYDPSDPGKRHGGDLQGIIDRLDYLADLGVTALWLNPILENDIWNSYHGYQATDLYRIDPRYGSNDDYRRLVEEAHARGIKIIFDHVNNHIGITHEWMDRLPAPTWINGTRENHLGSAHFKLAVADPYADPNAEERLRTFWFVDSMPDLNQRDPFLATYLIQNSLWWIETTGLDGIREDTYPYPDQAFLAEWAGAILDEYPNFNIVGEIWENQPAYLALFQKDSYLPRDFETNLPSVMDFALTDAFRGYLDGSGGLSDVYTVLAQDFLYTDPDNLFTMFDNHDMNRGIFIADGDTRKVKQVLTMLLTLRGIPQLLYGTEINMMGGPTHVTLRADFPGGFPGHTRDAFTEAGRTAEENDVFDFTRTLLRLRQNHPALTDGGLMHYTVFPWSQQVYAYFRIHADDTILVAVNGDDQPQRLDLQHMTPLEGATTFVDLLTGETERIDRAAGLAIDSRAVRILQVVR